MEADDKADDICDLSEKLKSQLLLIDGGPAEKRARQRTLAAMLQLVESGRPLPAAEPAAAAAAAPSPFAAVLQCLSDPSERCRELAAQLAASWLAQLPDRLPACALLAPVLRQRLAAAEPAEPSEEVRLQLVQLTRQLIDADGPRLAAFLEDLVAVLARAVADPSPEVKVAACGAAGQLARSLPRQFHLQGGSLVPPLLATVSHQRWRVREPCVRAIGDVVQYGDNSAVRDVISHLAQRMFDQVPQVRLAVTEVVGRWLVELPDRYSFFAKIVPLLLTSLEDAVPSVSEKAGQLWREAGDLYLKENEDEHRQLINYPPPPPDGYPEGVSRPSLGCRLLAQRCFCALLPGAVNDLTDWVASTRLKVSQLLHTLVLHQEGGVTQYLERIVTALVSALADDEVQVARWALRTAELLGCFVPVAPLTEVVLKPITGDGGATGRRLLVLAACLRGCPARQQMAAPVADLLASPDVCQSHEPVRQEGLLAAVEALLLRDDQPPPESAVAPLFRTLVTVLGHAAEETVSQKARDLVDRLSAAAGCGLPTLLERLGPSLLQQLSLDVDLWGPASSELLAVTALLTLTDCPPEALLRPAVPLLAACCRPGRAAPLRLACFSQLCRLVSGCRPDAVRPLLAAVTDDIVMPSIVWHPGRSDAAIRTAAISCLYMELQVPDISPTILTADLDKVITSVTGLLEEQGRQARLLSVRCLAALFRLAPAGSVPVQLVHTTATELLKRLDDTDAEVRQAAAAAFPALVSALGPDYCGSQWRGHVEYFAKTLLVFLDDPDARLQDLVYEALLSAGQLNASVVWEQTAEQRPRQRSPSRCDRLLKALRPASATTE